VTRLLNRHDFDCQFALAVGGWALVRPGEAVELSRADLLLWPNRYVDNWIVAGLLEEQIAPMPDVANEPIDPPVFELEGLDKSALKELAKAQGVKADGRWGRAKLIEELEK